MSPEFVDDRRRHPILAVEQDEAVETTRLFHLELIRERCHVGFHAGRHRLDRLVVFRLEVVGERLTALVVVAAAERLPREIVVVERKAAGEAANPLLVHVEQLATVIVLLLKHRRVLARRDAEAVDRDRLPAHPPHDAVLEQRTERLVEDLLLLGHRAGRQQPCRITPHAPRQAVHDPKKLPQLRLVVEAAFEVANPLRADRVAGPVARLPIGPRLWVEMVADEAVVVGEVVLVLAVAEEFVERFVVGKMLDRGELQPREAHVVVVEVNRHDPLRLVDQIVEDVAAPAGNREQARVRADLKRLGVDPRILPNLVVDKAAKPHREHALEHAALAGDLVVMNSFFEVGCGAWAGGKLGHHWVSRPEGRSVAPSVAEPTWGRRWYRRVGDPDSSRTGCFVATSF